MSLTKNSVVVITGAASGMGRALAVRLSKEPIKGIAVCDVDDSGLVETVELMNEGGPDITSHLVNVADESEMAEFVSEVIDEHGSASHVINNAGVALGGAVSEVSLRDIRWLMEINFWGVVLGTKLFLPHLQKEESAHIVNFSSVYGIIAPPGQGAYCASKFAVRGFTESLRHELEGTSVAVSSVHPGGVRTNIANKARIGEGVQLTEQEIEERKKKYNENLANTTPEEAAEIILRGIRKREPRIMVGSDSRFISVIARLFPKRYFPLLDRITGGKMDTT